MTVSPNILTHAPNKVYICIRINIGILELINILFYYIKYACLWTFMIYYFNITMYPTSNVQIHSFNLLYLIKMLFMEF